MDDLEIRLAAFAHLAKLKRAHGEVLNWDLLSLPFAVGSESILVANRARGIFKPRQMHRGALSLKTPVPRKGRVARYEDLVLGENDGCFRYCFQGESPDSHDNQTLREAFEDGSPLVYLFGLQEARYQVMFPAFITSWIPEKLMAEVAIQEGANPLQQQVETGLPVVRDPIERAYSTIQAKQRLHQAAFRLQVLDAYRHRCSICGFPRDELLDAAHILSDKDERGAPEVPNGLCLCRLHHGAFDTDLLGIRPDGTIEISEVLLKTRDGPTLEHGLVGFNGKTLNQPRSPSDRPSRIYLAERYHRFKQAA